MLLESKWVRGAAALSLIWFLWLTWGVLRDYSYIGFFLMAGANGATYLMFVDLAIGLTILTVWMIADARKGRRSYAPFVAVTLLFGIAGPLLYLVARPLRLRWQRGLGVAVLLGLSFAAATTWELADLRTPAVSTQGAAERGRLLLLESARRHGLAAWRQHAVLEVTAVDHWPGGSPWWPSNPQRVRSQALLGTFTSATELLSGPHAGETWGIQSWAPYRRASGKLQFLSEPAPEIEFYLPTLQYFNELPFRLLAADVALDAGPGELLGTRYQRVFVSWNRPEAHEEDDQYVLWIGEESGLIEMVRYTLRDAIRLAPPGQRAMFRALARGTIHYSDYRVIDGVMIPHRQTVVLPPPELTPHDLGTSYFHELVIERARFDAIAREELIPDPSRSAPADRKPETPLDSGSAS